MSLLAGGGLALPNAEAEFILGVTDAKMYLPTAFYMKIKQQMDVEADSFKFKCKKKLHTPYST